MKGRRGLPIRSWIFGLLDKTSTRQILHSVKSLLENITILAIILLDELSVRQPPKLLS